MTDLLEGGPPERQRRWPRVLAALLVVAVLGAGAVQRFSSGAVPTARPTTLPTMTLPTLTVPTLTVPTLTVPTLTLPSSAPPSAPPPEALPADPDATVRPELVGVPLREASRFSLVLGGPTLLRLGSRTAGLGTVPVAAGEQVVGVQQIAAGLVVTVSNGDGQTQPYARAYLVRRHGSTTLLAKADVVFPAADGGSVFAMTYGRTQTDPNLVTRVDLSGNVLLRRALPVGWSIDGDTVNGLLGQKQGKDPAQSLSTLAVLDRATMAVRSRLGTVGWVVSGAGDHAAWSDSDCDESCDLVVADLRTGARQRIPVEPGFNFGAVKFSPDGKRIAVAYYGRHPERAGGADGGFVDVVDLTTGVRQRVPGVVTDVKQEADLAWTPDGRWLAIAVGITGKNYRTVGLWPAAGGAVQLLPRRVPGDQTSGALLAL